MNIHITPSNQMRFERQQPYSLRFLPWDHQMREQERRERIKANVATVLACVGLLAVLLKGWVW